MLSFSILNLFCDYMIDKQIFGSKISGFTAKWLHNKQLNCLGVKGLTVKFKAILFQLSRYFCYGRVKEVQPEPLK